MITFFGSEGGKGEREGVVVIKEGNGVGVVEKGKLWVGVRKRVRGNKR